MEGAFFAKTSKKSECFSTCSSTFFNDRCTPVLNDIPHYTNVTERRFPTFFVILTDVSSFTKALAL